MEQYRSFRRSFSEFTEVEVSFLCHVFDEGELLLGRVEKAQFSLLRLELGVPGALEVGCVRLKK